MHKVIEYIKSDLYKYTNTTSFLAGVQCYFLNPTFRWQVAFRMVNANAGVMKFIGLFLWIINRNRNRIQISRHTNIGFGLYIGHNGPIVINPSCVIGNNCNLSQFTTIGSNKGKAAIIGDGVYIGPNVCIVENVRIGNNVTIGAGSVVTKDIPDNATAVGNYAKVIHFNEPGRFINFYNME